MTQDNAPLPLTFCFSDEAATCSDFEAIAEQVKHAYENAGLDLLKLAENDDSIEIEWIFSCAR